MVADHDVGHRARAVHQHPHLAADLPGQLGELAGEVVGEEPVGGKPALCEAAELLDVVGLQAVGIAEYADGYELLRRACGRRCRKGG